MDLKPLFGEFLGGITGAAPKAVPDGWLSGDDALERYSKSPDTLTRAVETERAKHLKCATDEKRLRCDVERILDINVCYLEFTCEGCGMSKRIQVNEKTGDVTLLRESIPVVNPMTKAERIAANVKANDDGRRYPQIYMPKITLPGVKSVLSTAQWYASSALYDSDGEKRTSAKPLVSGGGKIKRKLEPKAPAKPIIDRLRIVRAAPAHDEEV